MKRRSRAPWWIRYTVVVASSGLVVAITAAALAGAIGGLAHTANSTKAAPIVLSPLAVRSVISDRNGKEIAVLFADEDRQEVSLDRVPEAVQTAVLTIEDRDFYIHKGVNPRSMFRALFSNVQAGGITQGGSTITQQLIKNSIVGSEQTIERKAREAILSVRLEQQMTKDEILERYLNTVYLGHGAYGMQAAAETYFNKTVDQLGWSEAALLSALIRNPVGYDPIRYPELAAKRRALVTRRLVAEHHITVAEAATITTAPLPAETFSVQEATAQGQLAGANYFSEEVKQQLLALPELGATPQARYDSVFKGGLRVETPYDPDAQALAEKAVATLPDSKGRFTAALASVDPHTGAVRAVVGGTDFETQKINFATQGWRQPGSSFKFFTLMAAFDTGGVPTDTISGASPCRFPDPSAPKGVYQAENSGRSGKSGTILSQTLASSNCAFLRLGQSVGLDRVADMANRMGVRTLNPRVGADGRQAIAADGSYQVQEGFVPSDILSLPIGSKEVHPLAMAAAYATAANDGVYNPPYFISKVSDSRGKVLYEHRDAGVQVVSAQTARLVAQVLGQNVISGTGRNARLPKQPAAGKTGTTQDNADVWFVGFTPQLSTAVWIGSPKDRAKVTLAGKTQFGADFPSRIWKAFMGPYHDDLPVEEFPEPAPTRKGAAIKYSNKVDKRRSCVPTATRTCSSSPTTTIAGVAPVPTAASPTAPPALPAAAAPTIPPTSIAPPASTVAPGGGA